MTYVQYIIISRACPDHVTILARNARNYGKCSKEFPVNNFYTCVLLDPEMVLHPPWPVYVEKFLKISSAEWFLILHRSTPAPYRKIRFLYLPVWNLHREQP